MTSRNNKSQSRPEFAIHTTSSGTKKRGLRPVSPPLISTRLSRLLYILLALTVCLGAYYSYRILQYKTHSGGDWWGSGNRNPTTETDSIEDKINDLAKVLGVPSRELASAIAVVVRNYVPAASSSSGVGVEDFVEWDVL